MYAIRSYYAVGTTWKYWFADEFTTGYINVKVGAIVPKTGVISGTEEEITVDCFV